MQPRLAPGTAIGAYRVIAELAGRPGVYRAVHATMPRRAIIKVATAHDWRVTALDMLRAATMVEGLGHPGVAKILDHGVMPDRRPWLAAEAPDGFALGEVMTRRRLSSGELASMLHDVGEVLAHAHARGVVHKRLTPVAITLTTGSRGFPVCVGEWGDIRIDRDLDHNSEPTVFDAPERAITGKLDVFALGVIAYRAVTGTFPLSAVHDVPGAGHSLAALVIRMIALDPNARPTAAEVANEAGRLAPTLRQPRWTPQYPMSIELVAAQTAALAESLKKN
jgi:serine/threonine protein kinase